MIQKDHLSIFISISYWLSFCTNIHCCTNWNSSYLKELGI